MREDLKNITESTDERAAELESTIELLHKEITEHKKSEEALKIKDKALKSSINAIGMINTEANVIFINPSFLKLWRYDNENEVLGRSVFEFWQDKDKVDNVMKIISDKGNWIGELVARRKDDTFFDVQISASIVKDMEDKPICLMGSFLDITERKKAEKIVLTHRNHLETVKRIGALANSTLNLDNVLQRILSGTLKSLSASVGMIFLKDTETKTLKWGSHIGLSEEFVSEYNERHIRPGEGLTGRIAQTGEPIYIQKDCSHDLRIARTVTEKEGLNSFIGVPIFAAEEIVGVMNILTRPPETLSEDEVTLVAAIGSYVGSAIRNAQLFEDRKKAEESVLYMAKGVSSTIGEKFFYTLVEYLAKTLKADYAYVAEIIKEDPVSVRTLALSADGRIIDNIEVDLKGTPCETVREKLCSYSSGVQKLFPYAEMMAKMKVEGYVGTALFDSSCRWIGIMAVMYRKPVENVSSVESMLQIFAARAAAELERRQYEKKLKEAKKEISEWNKELEMRVREKTEELLKSEAQLIQAEKLSSLGQLAAGAAHELNSPLTGLISMTRNYRDNAEKDSEEYRHFSLMYKACEYMAKIVNDFKTFSSKSKGDHTECNLTEIIESSLSLVTNELKLKNIQLNKELADELPDVKGDKTELQQVVLNIITNAVDAMTDNGRLIIRTGISRDDNSVMIEFIDNGCGIRKKYINKVFEPFFTTKAHGKGTGLGLSVSYAIINNHGGKITVESEIGKETKFTVSLPVVT